MVKYLLDTKAIIYYLQAALPKKAMLELNKIVDEQALISIITKIELLGFNEVLAGQEIINEAFVDGALIFNLNNEIANEAIAMRKQYRIKLPDTVIAATAIVYDFSLLTRNIAGFDKIHGLKCIDPTNLQD